MLNNEEQAILFKGRKVTFMKLKGLDNLKDSDKFDIQVQLMLLASRFDSRIKPPPLSKQDLISDNPFVHEIKKTGIEIR